jgi:hypothetical protein
VPNLIIEFTVELRDSTGQGVTTYHAYRGEYWWLPDRGILRVVAEARNGYRIGLHQVVEYPIQQVLRVFRTFHPAPDRSLTDTTG